jgi:phosphoribosylformylglycinamidine (FGAM) synthase PurS component
MTIHRFITTPLQKDPRAADILVSARALGFHQLKRAECHDLYFIESQLSQEELQQLALTLLSDSVTQSISWDEMPAPLSSSETDSVILEVSLRPGVTDPVAAEIVRAAHELGLTSVHRAATGQRFILHFDPSVSQSEIIRLSASNPLPSPIPSSNTGRSDKSNHPSPKKSNQADKSKPSPSAI